MTMQRQINLTKRYNKDGTISLFGWKGRVVFKSRDIRSIQDFIEGWYGDSPITLNRTIFAGKKAAH
jgi:hypothetical protein